MPLWADRQAHEHTFVSARQAQEHTFRNTFVSWLGELACCVKQRNSDVPGLSYDPTGAPVSGGGDKKIYEGSYDKEKVAVIVAKKGGERRMLHEIGTFKRIGRHPHIIHMFCSGKNDEGLPFAVLEAVEPIGYDMSRLVNQYSWTGQVVPGALMCKLMRQLISAVHHLHQLELVHQDLKVQNVCVTFGEEVKLIDMGITARIGERGKLRASYMAPEICKYDPVTEKADCWGLGLILHQVYQKRGALLALGKGVNMKSGMPSDEHPMRGDVRETMRGLLAFDPSKRWSLQDTLDSRWFAGADAANHDSMTHATSKDSVSSQPPRRFLQRYVGVSGSEGSVTAYAARIGSGQTNVVGKRLFELDFGRKYGLTVLLIAHSDGTFERVPGKDTKIGAGTWIYFGIKPDGSQDDDDDQISPALTQVCRTLYGKSFDPHEKVHDTSEVGHLVTFTLEFDCFTFPDRPGTEFVLGADARPGQVALDLRRTMALNIAGIVTEHNGEEWYPQANSTVCPGDLGLVVRAPKSDGMSEPTVHDEDLLDLMDVSVPLRDKTSPKWETMYHSLKPARGNAPSP